MIGYVKIVVRLASWLNAHLTSGSHTSVNFHSILNPMPKRGQIAFILSQLLKYLSKTDNFFAQ